MGVGPHDLDRQEVAVDRLHGCEVGCVSDCDDWHRWTICEFRCRLASGELAAFTNDDLPDDVQERMSNLWRKPRHHDLRMPARGQIDRVRQAPRRVGVGDVPDGPAEGVDLRPQIVYWVHRTTLGDVDEVPAHRHERALGRGSCPGSGSAFGDDDARSEGGALVPLSVASRSRTERPLALLARGIPLWWGRRIDRSTGSCPRGGQNPGASIGYIVETFGMAERSPQEHVDSRVRAYYGTEFDESDRLVGRSGQGLLEFQRTQSMILDRLDAGSRIIDIGGGTGTHASALAERGHELLLIDPVQRHVEAAAAHGTFAVALGDSRSLPVEDDCFDAALLFGPLYHLVERSERLRAWGEAIRAVRPGGWIFAAAVSRLSAMAWVTVIEPSIAFADSGVPAERSPMPHKWRRMIEEGAGELGPRGFPGGHFHLADDLEQEALDAGLVGVRVVGVEGPGAQAIEISRSHDPELVAAARTLAEAFESQPGLRDLSPHLLAMGQTPAT